MPASARISSRPGLDWITALRAPQIKTLIEAGPLQLSLFDDRDLAEIASPDYPGERLIVCRNPLLAAERKRKRDGLLAATERDLSRIRQAVLRKRAPLRGEAEIGLAVGAVLDKHHKHFETAIADTSLVYRRADNTIAAEARLDGIYVIRTNVPKEALSPEETVGAYKALAKSSAPSARSRPSISKSARCSIGRRRACAPTSSSACSPITSSSICAAAWRPSCSTTMTDPPRPPNANPSSPS